MIGLTSLTNLSSNVPWGLWVSMYVWFVGISAGIYLFLMWGSLRNDLYLKKISRLGISLAISSLLAGLLSIQIDLGHIERFYKLFVSPSRTSIMAGIVWLYGFYFVILLVTLFGLKKGGVSKLFQQFGFLLALAVIFMESMLFALPPGKPWHSVFFPIHFLTSSLVSAIAALLFIIGIFWKKTDKIEILNAVGKIALPVVAINLTLEIIDLASISKTVHMGNQFIFIGNIVVIALLLMRNSTAVTLAGCAGLVSMLLSKHNTIVSAQTIEPFRGFDKVYIEPWFGFNYSPRIFEVVVSLSLVCLVAVLFYFLYRVLPLTREE